MDMDARTLGRNVLLSRRDLGMTQEDLAARVGVSRAYVTNIEQGRAKNVGIDVVFGLARELGVSPVYLLGLTQDPLDSGRGIVREDSGQYIVADSESSDELRQVVDEFIALSPKSRRVAINMMRSMRLIEEEDDDPLPPLRIIE